MTKRQAAIANLMRLDRIGSKRWMVECPQHPAIWGLDVAEAERVAGDHYDQCVKPASRRTR